MVLIGVQEVDQDYVITSMTEDVDMVDADAEEEEVEGALAGKVVMAWLESFAHMII